MSTITRLDEGARPHAALVAANLKERLLPLVLGQQRPAFSCPCDAMHAGYAEAFDIIYPDIDGDSGRRVGLWRRWSVVMRERWHDVPSHCLSLGDFVSKTQLYAMFRDAFGNFDLPLELPVVQILSGQSELTAEFSQRRGFTAARSVVTVRPGEFSYLQPEPSDDAALWADATISVGSVASDEEPLVSIRVDGRFKHLDTSLAESSRRYIGGQSGADNLLTFVVAEGTQEKDARVPLARLVGFDQATGVHTFELAEGVTSESSQEVQPNE